MIAALFIISALLGLACVYLHNINTRLQTLVDLLKVAEKQREAANTRLGNIDLQTDRNK